MNRRELVRNVLSGERPETSCLKVFPAETLADGLLQEHPEPSSQGGSVGSNPIGATA